MEMIIVAVCGVMPVLLVLFAGASYVPALKRGHHCLYGMVQNKPNYFCHRVPTIEVATKPPSEAVFRVASLHGYRTRIIFG